MAGRAERWSLGGGVCRGLNAKAPRERGFVVCEAECSAADAHAADDVRAVIVAPHRAAGDIAAAISRRRGRRSNHPEDYPEYLKGCDIASFDIYPANHGSKAVAGNLWYVGGIEGEGQPREFELKTTPLGAGPWTITLIEDGDEINIDEADLNSMVLQIVSVARDNGLKIPREFALLIKQFLYFDRYAQILAPGMSVYQPKFLPSAKT